jgi:integrase
LKGTSVESKEIIYLEKDEVKRLEDMTFNESQAALERVRDVFLFCCFTGLRYSDVKKLTRYDIRDGVIVFVTKKTVDGIRVELNKHSQAILDKYKDVPFPGHAALPVISNEKMNAHLKDLGKLAGLDTPTRVVWFVKNVRHEELFPKWQLMTTHVARRTFVVNALRLGIPPEVIMRWTGHSSFESMKPYMKIIDEVKRTAMSKFDDF